MKLTRFLLLFLIIILVTTYILMLFLPPYLKDELYYTLGMPHLWKTIGEISTFYWFTPSHFPPLFFILYYFTGPEHFVLLHLSGLIASALLLTYLIIHMKNFETVDTSEFYLLVFLFLIIPVVGQIVSTSYVDIWVATFIFAGIFHTRKYLSSGEPYHLVVASIFFSLSFGTKYTSIPLLLSSILLIQPFFPDNKKRFIFLSSVTIATISLNWFWLWWNYQDTGNPLFPLLPGILQLKEVNHYNPTPVRFSTYIDPLTLRKLVYHESTLKMLLAPIRVFFYGKDGVPALFDGSLAPYLIIFPIFAGFREKWHRFFLFASLFFILIVFFTQPLRARYLLPVVPFLLQLSIKGFGKIYNKNRIIALLLLSATLIHPVKYYFSHLSKTETIPYILGKLSTDEWKKKHVIYKNLYDFINSSSCKKVFLYFTGRRGYYIEKPFMFEPSTNIEGNWLLTAVREHTFLPFKRFGVDCLAINKHLFARFISINFTNEDIKLYRELFASKATMLYNDEMVEVIKIK